MLFLQIDINTLSGSSGSVSLFDLAVKGGVLMIPITLLLFIALYIFLERIFILKKASRNPFSLMEQVKGMVLKGDLESAKKTCLQANTPIGRMIHKGLQRIGGPLKNIEASIENVGRIEVYRLEKNISLLATIAGSAPMLGFLGTVIGMVQAFLTISELKGAVNPQVLSSGIYIALITTVAGLVVGIIAHIAYNYLVARVQKVVHYMEYISMDFLDLLQEPQK